MLTLSTCFYIVKSKFNIEKYQEWMSNFLLNVNHFNLVIYTNKQSYIAFEPFIETINNNPKIIIIFRELEEFYMYKYRDNWIKNQEINTELKQIGWELNMLWSEKIFFVYNTIINNYFNTEWHGWCDIGYFRNRPHEDTYSSTLFNTWPNRDKIQCLDINKIYYARVNYNNNDFDRIIYSILNKNENGLPREPIPANQVSIAGGFFLCHKDNINNWKNIYNKMLELYFNNNYLVKDDQMIIINCIVLYSKYFEIVREENYPLDSWFLFQSYLL